MNRTHLPLLALSLLAAACGRAENQDAMNDAAKDWALNQHEVPAIKASPKPSSCQVAEEPAPDANNSPDPSNGAVVPPKVLPQGVATPSASDPMVTVIYRYESGGRDVNTGQFFLVTPKTTVAQFPMSVWLASANALPCVKSFAGPGQFMCDFTTETRKTQAANCDGTRFGYDRDGTAGCAPVRLVQSGTKVTITLEKVTQASVTEAKVENPIIVVGQ